MKCSTSGFLLAASGILASALTLQPALLAQTNTPPATATPQTPDDPPRTNDGWRKVGDNAQVSGGDEDDVQAQPAPLPANPPVQAAPRSNTPVASGPVPATLTLQKGTYLTVRVNQSLSSDKNQPGDRFTASLMQPVIANGVVVAQPGQVLGGEVAVAEKHSSHGPGRLGLQLMNLTLVDGQQVPLLTQFVNQQGSRASGGSQVGTVATTTGVGAAIGAIAGWGTGAAIGAGAGAAAGLVGILVTRNHASVIYPEQVLTFQVQAPVSFSTTGGQQAFRYVQPNEYERPVYTNTDGRNLYESAAPAPPVYNVYNYGGYGLGYPYGYGYGFGWGYPYLGFGIYRGGYWGRPYYYGRPGYYRGGFRGRPGYGGHFGHR